MKNFISPFIVLVIGPAAAVLFYIGGYRESVDAHTLKLVLFEMPIAAIFAIALLRGKFAKHKEAGSTSRFESTLDVIQVVFGSMAFVYFVFFQFGAK